MNSRNAGAVILVALAGLACGGRVSRPTHDPVTSATDTDWLTREPVACGEVRGRVLDARSGVPMAGAYVTIDSIAGGVSTDSLGRFRITVLPDAADQSVVMRSTVVRIRRIGMLELRVYLPANLGYAVEASLAPTALHADHVSTLRIKTPGFCVRAT